MRPCPKDPPIVNRDLLIEMKLIIQRCEWPGCRDSGTDAAHVRARGMGGGRRKDTPDNIVVLCRRHHTHYDHGMGQSLINQSWVYSQIIEKRAPEILHQIRCFLDAQL